MCIWFAQIKYRLTLPKIKGNCRYSKFPGDSSIAMKVLIILKTINSACGISAIKMLYKYIAVFFTL